MLFTEGEKTSEARRTRMALYVGTGISLAGTATSVWSLAMDHNPWVGVVIVFIGAALAGASTYAYARSRAVTKSALASMPTRHVPPPKNQRTI